MGGWLVGGKPVRAVLLQSVAATMQNVTDVFCGLRSGHFARTGHIKGMLMHFLACFDSCR